MEYARALFFQASQQQKQEKARHPRFLGGELGGAEHDSVIILQKQMSPFRNEFHRYHKEKAVKIYKGLVLPRKIAICRCVLRRERNNKVKKGNCGRGGMEMLGFPLSFRALFFGAALSVVVAAYSAFAGLKVGGVYWPIVTTSLVSLVFLLALGKTSKNEINIMQTAGSSGGLLAAGIIFTIPAAFMMGIEIFYLYILLVFLIAA